MGTGVLAAADVGGAACGISPLGGVTISPTIEPPELTEDWGNRLWEGTNRT